MFSYVCQITCITSKTRKGESQHSQRPKIRCQGDGFILHLSQGMQTLEFHEWHFCAKNQICFHNNLFYTAIQVIIVMLVKIPDRLILTLRLIMK